MKTNPMTPIDRIAQLAEENRQLRQSLAKLAKDKNEILEQLFVACCFVEDCLDCEDYKPGIVSARLKAIRETISNHDPLACVRA